MKFLAGPPLLSINPIPWLQNIQQEDYLFVVLMITIAGFLFFSALLLLYSILIRIRNNREAKRAQKIEFEWAPLILGLLTEDITIKDIRQKIKKNEILLFIEYLVEYARRLKGPERHLVQELAKDYLPLIEKSTRRGNHIVRAKYIQALGLLGLPEYEEKLLDSLDDPSPLVAMVATRSLAQKGNDKYIKPILQHFHRFEGWDDTFLASLLAGVGTGAIPHLLDIYEDRRLPDRTRQDTAIALNTLNASVASDAAATILHTTKNRDLLSASLKLIRNVGAREHAEAVRDLFPIRDTIVLAQALSTLGRIGNEKDLKFLQPALDHPSSWVAIHAARSIRNLGGVEFLKGIADSDHQRSELARQVLAEDKK